LFSSGCLRKQSPIKAAPADKEDKATTVVINDMASANISLGAADIPLISLVLRTGQPDVIWKGLKLIREGDALDTDIPQLKLYLDNGDDKFEALNDTVVGLGEVKGGRVEIKLSPEQSITIKAQKYFIVVEINKSAAIGARFNFSITEGAFEITDPAGISSANYPFTTKLIAISSTAENLLVTVRNMTPSYFKPGSNDIPLLMLILKAEKTEIVWAEVKFARFGTCTDADITALKIYLDDNDFKFDPNKDLKIGEGSFVSGSAAIDVTDQVIKTENQIYFVTVDISSGATNNTTFGIKCPEPACFRVLEPNTVASASFPFISGIKSDGTKIGMDLKDVVEERERELTIRQQENEFIAQKYYETALKLYKEFNYQQSLDNVGKALEYNPRHKNAEQLQIELRRLLFGSRAEQMDTVVGYLEKQLQIKIQETEMEVRNHFLKAEKFMAEGKYEEAITQYEAVEAKIKWDPYNLQILAKYRTEAKERLKVAQEKVVKAEEEKAIRQRLAAAEVARLEEEKRRQDFNEKIKRLFEEALFNFQQQHYKKSEQLAEKILELVPTFKAASELKNDAVYAQHKKLHDDYLKLRLQGWKITQEQFEEGIIPYSDFEMVRYDKEAWRKAQRREPPGLIEKEVREDPDIIELKNKLNARDDFMLGPERNLIQQLDLLKQKYAIEYTIDQTARETIAQVESKEVPPIRFSRVTLRQGLEYILKPYSLIYTFDRERKALAIVTSATPTEDLVLRVYNVTELVTPVENFPGPTLELPTTSGGAFPPLPQTATPTKQVGDVPTLITNLKANAGRNRWEGDLQGVVGSRIEQIADSNRILVVHTPEVQKEVAEFLQVLRSFAGTMVAVEAIFLGVTDDFLESVGVQIRDLAGAPSVLESTGVAGYADQTADHDLRFRAAYSFMNQAGVQDRVARIGGRLIPTGGLGFQYALLGSTQLNTIGRALQKKEKATMLDAPKVMAMNAQRVNVVFLHQQTYIRDLDAISGAAAYDPVLDTFQTGVVLDVTPIVSYDRKYITMHTLPVLIQLQQLRPFNISSGTNTESGNFMQLPWIEYQRACTSVIVPDKGTLLIGGMRKVDDIDLTASTPFLDKIPLLGSLFRYRSKTLEKRNLVIMIRGEIVDLSEKEREIE
jgi:tetratricopeptide (TPR) repeat protein